MTQQPRIAIWSAVSTEDQAGPEKESLDYQRRLNLEHVARVGGIIVADLIIPGISRNIELWEDACDEIPEFAQLDNLLKRKAIDILMCQDVTRLGRDRHLVLATARHCERAGVRIYETTSPPSNLDGPVSTADWRLMLMVKAHMSEEEVRKFAERATFGRQAQVRKGKHANHPPIGLKKEKRLVNGEIEQFTVIDEAWRPQVELFYDLYVFHGRSQLAVAREFNERGYRTPNGRLWDAKTIRVFLKNRWAYAGYVTWGTWSKTPEKSFRVKAEWEPIISEEMARAAEQGMKERSQKPKAAGRPHRFSMMLRCKQCGYTMATCYNKSKLTGEQIPGYICRLRCKGTYIREVLIIAAVDNAIRYLRDDAQLEALVGETPPEHATNIELLEESRKALDAVAKERKRLTQAYARDTIDIEEYEELMADLKQRTIDLSAAITELEDQLAATPTADERRNRLLEIRDKGSEMLHHPDRATANNWMRRHFIVYVEKNDVSQIHLY